MDAPDATGEAPGFEVSVVGQYIKLLYTRQPTAQDMKEANIKVLRLHEQEGVNRLLCDVRRMSSEVSLPTQLEGVRLLWQLRSFEKFAFIISDKELEKLLASSFMNMKFMHKFKAFADENSAVEWLQSEE